MSTINVLPALYADAHDIVPDIYVSNRRKYIVYDTLLNEVLRMIELPGNCKRIAASLRPH